MAGLLTACETGKDNFTADSSPGADFDIRTQALRVVAIGERDFMMRTALGAFRKRLPSVTTATASAKCTTTMRLGVQRRVRTMLKRKMYVLISVAA
jgi:hypothetical protein